MANGGTGTGLSGGHYTAVDINDVTLLSPSSSSSSSSSSKSRSTTAASTTAHSSRKFHVGRDDEQHALLFQEYSYQDVLLPHERYNADGRPADLPQVAEHIHLLRKSNFKLEQLLSKVKAVQREELSAEMATETGMQLHKRVERERKLAQSMCRAVMQQLHRNKLHVELSSSSSPSAEPHDLLLNQRVAVSREVATLTLQFESELDRFTVTSRQLEKAERVMMDMCEEKVLTPPSKTKKRTGSRNREPRAATASIAAAAVVSTATGSLGGKKKKKAPKRKGKRTKQQHDDSPEHQQQQQTAIVRSPSSKQEVRQRLNEIKQIEQDVLEVMDMFTQVQVLVTEQQETIDTIESNIQATKERAGAAVAELHKADDSQRRARKRRVCLVLVVLIAVAIVLLSLFAN